MHITTGRFAMVFRSPETAEGPTDQD